MKRLALLLIAAALGMTAAMVATDASAQYVVYRPVTTYYAPAVVPTTTYSVARPVAVAPAPTVTYYQPPTVTYYRAPTVTYQPTTTVVTRRRPILGGTVTRNYTSYMPVVY